MSGNEKGHQREVKIAEKPGMLRKPKITAIGGKKVCRGFADCTD
jgi:hypothetical protein